MSNLSNEQAVALVEEMIAKIAPDVAEELPELDRGEDLWAALGLDSMDHLNVMTELSERTGREIPEREYGRLRSVESLAEYLVAGST